MMAGKDFRDGFTELVEIMARLRDPEKGCPWDLQQDFKTIVPYTLEEAYEVADAIERDDLAALKGELGDLLLQVVFYAEMAQEAGLFDMSDVCEGINDKMKRRHPHIFAEESLDSADDVSQRWDDIKQAERRENQADTGQMHDIPHALPALSRAHKVQRRAAHIGFDWPDISGVWDKIGEEQDELRVAIKGQDTAHIEEEMGDLLFSCVNLSRHIKVDAETALRRAVMKFESRFCIMESLARQASRELTELDTAEMELLWQQAKNTAAS